MRLFFFLLLIALFSLFLPPFCLRQTGSFFVGQIEADGPSLPSGRLPSCFDAPFSYLNSGGQAHVFASADGQYVIKFFKSPKKLFPLWLLHLPFFAPLKRNQERKEKKFVKDLTSYQLAFDKLKQESGLLYLHLGKTENLDCQIELIDKIGAHHWIDLDRVQFLIQKRADVSIDACLAWIRKGDLQSAKEAIDSIYRLILHRCRLAIHDSDAKIGRNMGLIDREAMFIDVGKMRQDEKRRLAIFQKRDIDQIFSHFNKQLGGASPEIEEYITGLIKNHE